MDCIPGEATAGGWFRSLGERRPLRRAGAGRGTGASVGLEALLPSPPCALLQSEASLEGGAPGGEVPGWGNAGRGPTSPPATPPDFAVASRGSGRAH